MFLKIPFANAQTIPLDKTVSRAKCRQVLNGVSTLTAQIQNNFIELFIKMPSTKIAQTLLLCWSKWPPELIIEVSLNNIS